MDLESIQRERPAPDPGRTEAAPVRKVEAFAAGSPQDRLLSSALATLERIGPERERLALGGGSVLAARWGHRPPGAVALFADPWEWREAFRRAGEGPGLERLLAGAGATETGIQSHWMSWRTPDGVVGVFSDGSRAKGRGSRPATGSPSTRRRRRSAGRSVGG